MKLSRIHLLAACAASSFVASAAQANVPLPTVELRGAGATTIGDVNVRVLNCIGNPGNHVAGDIANNRENKYGTNAPQLLTIEPGLYNPTTPSGTNPIHNCETQEIQPDFQGKYIGTGSGGGRQMWRTFTTNPPLTGVPGQTNPFGTWTNLQYAFSEGPITPSDVTAYNANANSATNGAGAAIQVPFFVIPIAFAYNPNYGVNNGVNMKFNVKVPGKINNLVAGGLKLSRVAYCKIFNGEITNWNDALLKTLNTNTSLHDPVNDTLARWNAEGAPIRLVGRADRSGGTDVFTRAMAAQCDGGQVALNKYDIAAESLPYDNASTIDIRLLRPDSRYFPASTGPFSGPAQSLGGIVFDRVTDNFCEWNELTSTQCDPAFAPFNNAPTPGLFIVADGSSGVAEAIETTANNALIASTTAGISLNGKFGYVGADFVSPVPGRNLFSAALQKGNSPTGTAYVMPSATNASAAFGTVIPPQAIATSGAYNITDSRTLGANDPSLPIAHPTNGGASVPVDRANPLHWTAILYNPNVPITSTLASPANGYPVTGSAFLLTYTCFKPANPAVPGNNAKRFGIIEFLGLSFGKITKNSVNTTVSANTFKGTGATSLGIISQSNTTVPSAGWQNAIWETFGKKSTQDGDTTVGIAKLGDRNLWIQDNTPTTLTDVDNIVQATDQKSNPGCDPNKGA